MSRKLITDWDEYFEHRQEVQYQIWKRWYKNRIDEARNKELARQMCSQRLHILDAVSMPTTDGRFGGNITSDGELIDVAYDAQVDYYTRLYENFKITWQFHQRKPVTVFLKNTAPESVRMFRARMADPFDWDEQLKAQTEAAEYVQSDLGKREIVNWLGFCAARDRILPDLIPIDEIDLDISLNKPFSHRKDNPELSSQPAMRGRSRKGTLPEIPVTQTTFSRRYDLGKAYQDLDNKDKLTSQKEIMQAVANSNDADIKTLERSIKLKLYIDANCPADFKGDKNKIHKWLIALKNSLL